MAALASCGQMCMHPVEAGMHVCTDVFHMGSKVTCTLCYLLRMLLQAVRREVQEEARVQVADVAVVGSQPWPVGRYGTCELMLGCIAQATSYEIITNTQEVREEERERVYACVYQALCTPKRG